MNLITPSGGLLFWMVLIFATVFFILAKFGFPVITSMVRKRSDFIGQSLEDARKAREQLDGIHAEYDRMIAQARQEQTLMLAQARKSSADIVEQAKADAAKESARMLERTRQEMEKYKREVIEDVGSEVAVLAIGVAEKVLRERLADEAGRKALTDKLIAELSEKSRNDRS